MSYNDQEYRMVQALIDFKEPKYAADSMGMSQKHFNHLLSEYNIPTDIYKRYEKGIAVMQQTLETSEKINALITSAIPATQKEKFRNAETYSDKDDLIQSIVGTMADFIVDGFHVTSTNPAVRDFCNSVNRDYNIDAVVHQMGTKAARVSNVPFYSHRDGSEITAVSILDPIWLEVIPLNYFDNKEPQKAVIQHISDEFKQTYAKARNGQYQNVQAFKDMLKDMPENIVRAIRGQGVGSGRDGVELLPANGDFVEIINYKGCRDRLVDPTMTAVFPDIRLRQMIRDGDYNIVYHIKHLIHQIAIGDPTDNNANTPFWAKVLENRLTDETAQQILAKYKSVEKVQVEVTDGNLKHIYNFPDPRAMDPKKYAAVQERILLWGGIALILLDGSQSNYGGGYIYMKSLVAKVRKWRRMMQRTLERFYCEVAPASGRGAIRSQILDAKTRPHVRFNNNFNKEPKQILDEVKFLSDSGGIDWESLHEEMDMSHDVIVARKKLEWEAVKRGEQYLYPIFEKSQSLLISGVNLPYKNPDAQQPGDQTNPDGTPGNPDKNGLQKNTDGRPRQPRPSEGNIIIETGIIKKDGDYWYVYNHDGTKKLSKGYKTKKEANKRLKQIEYFKNKAAGALTDDDIADLRDDNLLMESANED